MDKTEFFENVFGIKPIMKVKKCDDKSFKVNNSSNRG